MKKPHTITIVRVKMGRPSIDPFKHRSVTLHFKVTLAEERLINQAAARTTWNRSMWIRKVLLEAAK